MMWATIELRYGLRCLRETLGAYNQSSARRASFENKWRRALVRLIIVRRVRVLDDGFRYFVRVDLIGTLRKLLFDLFGASKFLRDPL